MKMMSLITITDLTSTRCEARGILAYHRMAHFVLTLSYIQMKVSDFL